VKQPQKIALAEKLSDGQTATLDGVRFAQFLDLQRSLLLTTGDPDPADLAARLVQGVAVFLRIPGAAVGVMQDGCYGILGTYGVGPDYAARYDGLTARDPLLGPALAHGRTIVLSDAGQTSLVLPFRGLEVSGGLHLVLAANQMLRDDDLELASALSLLTGVALTNACQCRRLTQVARLKGDALTAMAHDLRAPLNALIGYASLLGEGAFGTLSNEQRDISATLERQAIELVDLLGATLDVARLEIGRLPVRLDDFALGDVLATLTASTFAQATRDGRLTYGLSPDLPRLRTDRVKVKQIVQNLVDNALKHSGKSGVAIEAALAPERDTVRITVRDGGPGIAADVLPHLFEPFRPGADHGTGFGLYIVRCFAEALGGRVAARSLASEGTAVTVELPLRFA
jgi:signal transduction histidine kinase